MQKSGYLLYDHHVSLNDRQDLSPILRYSFFMSFLHFKNICFILLSFRDVEVIIFPFFQNVNMYFLIFLDFIIFALLVLKNTKRAALQHFLCILYRQIPKDGSLPNRKPYLALSLPIFSIVFLTSL